LLSPCSVCLAVSRCLSSCVSRCVSPCLAVPLFLCFCFCFAVCVSLAVCDCLAGFLFVSSFFPSISSLITPSPLFTFPSGLHTYSGACYFLDKKVVLNGTSAFAKCEKVCPVCLCVCGCVSVCGCVCVSASFSPLCCCLFCSVPFLSHLYPISYLSPLLYSLLGGCSCRSDL
jgi:hypothetical protein